MKKLVLMLSVLALVASCGSNKKSIYGDGVLKDKNGVVIGYYSRGLNLTQLLDTTSDTAALNGFWANINTDTGLIDFDYSFGGPEYFFSNNDCTGTVYWNNSYLKNRIVKPLPYLSGTFTAATAASQVVFQTSTPATLTDKVKSALVIDTTPTTTYFYDPQNENTWRFTCLTVAASGLIPGTCKIGTNTLCTETVDSTIACQTWCGLAPQVAAGAVWTPSGDGTTIPISDDTYNNNWTVLTELTTATTPPVPTEWAAVAPLYIDVYENQ